MSQGEPGRAALPADRNKGVYPDDPEGRPTGLRGVHVEQHNPALTVDLTAGEPRIAVNEASFKRSRLATSPAWKRIAKRVFDIAGAALALVIFAPLMILTAAAVAVTSPGPVFFIQERIGFLGERFSFVKFRSMCDEAESLRENVSHRNKHGSGPIFKIDDDPRLTWLGSLIRRYSIDELPQLFHVLSGKMSLVGPRPLPYDDLIAHLAEEDDPVNPDQMRPDLLRLIVKPGITCIWQVSGRSELDYETWLQMDLEYIQTWSLLLDLKILLHTIPAVLSGRGAY